MKEWQTLRIEYSLVRAGVFDARMYPKILVVDPSGEILVHEKIEASKYLQKLGLGGWELASVCPNIGHGLIPGSQTTTTEILWFKRLIERP